MLKYKNGWTKEKVIEHVTKEFKGFSHDPKRGCLYRGPEGKKCIAGCFLTDEMDFHEERSIASLMQSDNEIRNSMPFSDADMSAWQNIHDYLDRILTVEDQLNILLNFLER